MKRLEFGESDKLSDVLNAIEQEPDKEIEIFVFPGSDVLKLSTNIEIINSFSQGQGKKITIKGDFGAKAKEPSTEAGKEDNLGFVEGRDVAGEKAVAPKEEQPPAKKSKSLIQKLLSGGFLKNRKRLYIALGVLGVLIFVGLITLWFVPSANVTLFTQPQFKEAELNLVASASVESVDKDKGLIPLKTLQTTQEDVIEAKATGTKTVGTQAKGRIKIINRETKDKKFFAGTKIKSLSGGALTFTLNNTATISAAPAGCTNDCPETAVNVTAVGIGDKGNLPAGTKFQVGSVTDTTKIVAEGLTKFTGGSSKKLTIVSTSDHKKAKNKLLEKLEEQARKKLENENPDVIVPEGGLKPKIAEEVYSKKVGEEAETFRLNLKVEFTANVFSEEDLKDLLIESISDTIPEDFQIDREGSAVEAEIIDTSGEQLEILGSIKASLLPEIDAETVIRKIAGKDFSTTDRYLKALNSVSGFEIKMSPSFFRIFGTMPFLKGGIKIEVMQEEEEEEPPASSNESEEEAEEELE
jgi:hypothetical protein